MPHPALGKRVALEHDVDRLEVEFGGHVVHGAIFVVEMLGCIGALVIALDEEFEHLPMRDHRSEEDTSELQSLMRISYAVVCLKRQKFHNVYIHIIPTIMLNNII